MCCFTKGCACVCVCFLQISEDRRLQTFRKHDLGWEPDVKTGTPADNMLRNENSVFKKKSANKGSVFTPCIQMCTGSFSKVLFYSTSCLDAELSQSHHRNTSVVLNIPPYKCRHFPCTAGCVLQSRSLAASPSSPSQQCPSSEPL